MGPLPARSQTLARLIRWREGDDKQVTSALHAPAHAGLSRSLAHVWIGPPSLPGALLKANAADLGPWPQPFSLSHPLQSVFLALRLSVSLNQASVQVQHLDAVYMLGA